jgi:hypothetical protein
MLKYKCLLSLVLLAGIPDSKIGVPINTNDSFQYKLSYDGPGKRFDKDNIGTSNWRYRRNGGIIENKFSVNLTHEGVAFVVGSHGMKIFSKTRMSTGYLEQYVSEDFDKSGNSKSGIRLQRINEEVRTQCKRKDRQIVCEKSVKRADMPDLYVLLATATYVKNLKKEVATNLWHEVYYNGKQGKVRLQKSNRDTVKTSAYSIEGFSDVMKIPGLTMKVWLSKDYPHFMEKSEVKIPLMGKVIIKKK